MLWKNNKNLQLTLTHQIYTTGGSDQSVVDIDYE